MVEANNAWNLFHKYAFEKQLPFDHLPWQSIKTEDQATKPRYWNIFHWALKNAHVSILRALRHLCDDAKWRDMWSVDLITGLETTGPDYVGSAFQWIKSQSDSNSLYEFYLTTDIRYQLDIAIQKQQTTEVTILLSLCTHVNKPSLCIDEPIILSAVRSANPNIVVQILQSGADINARSVETDALDLAILKGVFDVVTILLDWHVRVNHNHFQGAVTLGLLNICEVYLSKKTFQRVDELSLNSCFKEIKNLADGVDRETIETNFLLKAILSAASFRQTNVVRLILKSTMVVNQDGSLDTTFVETALYELFVSGNIDMIEYMVKPDISVEGYSISLSANSISMTALAQELSLVTGKLVEKILRRLTFDTDLRDYELAYENALIFVCTCNDSLMLKWLLQGPYKTQSSVWNRVMSKALKDDKPKVIAEFLSAGFGVNEEIDGHTPLYIAAEHGCLSSARVLINNKADVNDDLDLNSGDTPLNIAIKMGHEPVIRLLLVYGADSNYRTTFLNGPCRKTFTPLHTAIRYGQSSAVAILLEYGAIAWEKCDGETPLCRAAFNGNPTIVRLLLQQEINVDEESLDGWTPLCTAAERGYSLVVDSLLQYGARIDKVCHAGCTPLHLAAANGHVQVVDVLLHHYAIFAACISDNIDPKTPIHTVLENVRAKVVGYPDKRNTSINAKDVRDATPLWVAASHGHYHVVKTLLDHGADADIVDNVYQRSPLETARKRGFSSIVNLLSKERMLT